MLNYITNTNREVPSKLHSADFTAWFLGWLSFIYYAPKTKWNCITFFIAKSNKFIKKVSFIENMQKQRMKMSYRMTL